MSDPAASIPEHLPGEPPLREWSPAALLLELTRKLLLLGALLLLSLPFWPVYLVARCFLRRPPNLTPLARILRCLGWIAAERVPPPGLSDAGRIALALSVLQHWAVAPLFGLAWFLDELLYGRALRRVAITAPLFELSAARSGSTQLAHYLEDDPRICAPSLLQSFLPYVWLWRLAAAVPARLVSRERVRQAVLGLFPPAYLERHELDPFRTDTFEVIFHRCQLGHVTLSLGPRIRRAEISPGRLTPESRGLWETEFVDFLDGVARKALLFAQRDGAPRRLMIKGHFLAVAPLLVQRYPDARFLTVLRAPDRRIQSVINFWRSHDSEPLCGPVPWVWLVPHALEAELTYCDAELAWFRSAEGPRRCVVRFDEYVRDLPGTLRTVYRECLDLEAPSDLTDVHAPRRRGPYRIDRSLEQLGVDVEALNQRLEAYRSWCRA